VGEERILSQLPVHVLLTALRTGIDPDEIGSAEVVILVQRERQVLVPAVVLDHRPRIVGQGEETRGAVASEGVSVEGAQGIPRSLACG